MDKNKIIFEICLTMDHGYGLYDAEKQNGIRTQATQIFEHHIQPIIEHYEDILKELQSDMTRHIGGER